MKRFLLGLVLIFLASCSKQPASLALVPSDAAWVVSIDFKSLYQKAPPRTQRSSSSGLIVFP